MNDTKFELRLPDRTATMSHEDYHRHPATGSGSLKRILRSPAHYKQELDSPSSPTPAQRMGSAIHAAILEPERFEERAAAIPNFEGKGARANLQTWRNANKGRLLLKSEEMAAIDGILAAIRGHATARELLREGTPLSYQVRYLKSAFERLYGGDQSEPQENDTH